MGAKVDFETFGATLSAFQITQPTGFTDLLTRVFGVIGDQRNRGLEGTVFGALAPGLRLLGGAAFLDARLTRTRGGVYDGNPAAGAPRIQVNAGLEWDVPTADGLTAIAQLVQTGAAYSGTPLANGPSRQSVPDWTTVDLGLRYTTRLRERPVTLRATVTNVADRHYWIVNPYGALILGAPRTAWLSAAVDF
ncbi:TonB-dependent receptor domain-containing protein [Methylobacterium oryzae CBMB20]